MNPQTIFTILGAILLLVGVIGGFELKELKIPKVKWPFRVISFLLGIILLLNPLYDSKLNLSEKVDTLNNTYQPEDPIQSNDDLVAKRKRLEEEIKIAQLKQESEALRLQELARLKEEFRRLQQSQEQTKQLAAEVESLNEEIKKSTKSKEILEKRISELQKQNEIITESLNDSSDSKFTLRVTTKTANKRNAKTDKTDVFILLNGDLDTKRQLNNEEIDDFEQGEVNYFNFKFDYPLSKVNFILVDVVGDDAWLCESVSFQFFQDSWRSDVIKFEVNEWFSSVQEEDVTALKSKEFRVGEYLKRQQK